MEVSFNIVSDFPIVFSGYHSFYSFLVYFFVVREYTHDFTSLNFEICDAFIMVLLRKLYAGQKQQLELDVEQETVPNKKKSTSRLYIVTLLI